MTLRKTLVGGGSGQLNGVLQHKREIGPNSKYSKEKWRLIIMEQGWGSIDRKLLNFLLNKNFAEGRPG